MHIPQIKASPHLSHYANKNICTLDFSDSPSGTHKYLRSQKIVLEAMQNNADRICMITSGNAGYALLQEVERVNAAREKKIVLTFIVDEKIPDEIILPLQSQYVTILRKNLDEKFLTREEKIALSKEKAHEIVIDATELLSIDVSTIVSQFRQYALEAVVLPVGSGEFYLSLWNEIRKIQSSVKLIGVVPKDGHPLCARARGSLGDFYNVYRFNDFVPSLSFSLLPNNVRDLLLQTTSEGCSFVDVDNADIEKAYALSLQVGFDVEVSASVSFALLDKEVLQRKTNILCVLTGKSKEYRNNTSPKKSNICVDSIVS